jgi:hypothetical protein
MISFDKIFLKMYNSKDLGLLFHQEIQKENWKMEGAKKQ